MNTLYLIRHGKTPANEAHLYCGSTDLPLSDAGIAELKTLHYQLSPGEIVTSGMKRTEQTLHLLLGDVPHTQDPGFREIDFGDFELQSYEQLKDRPDYQAWISGDNHRNVPPNGESGFQMQQRVFNALKPYLHRDHPVLIVSHGGVIAAIMAALFPGEDKNLYQWQPRPGHGYAVTDGGYQSIP